MMVKSRKFSKGRQVGFVPNYRHAVETMAESEGFGSCGRVETEMTVSEDSCQPQGKCLSPNVESYGHINYHAEVLSLSMMSKSERKELEIRLKRELDQVRILQKKGASLATNAVILSPVSDIHSCSDGRKRSAFESSQAAPEQSTQARKHGPPVHNGPHVKAGIAHVEPPKHGMPGCASNSLLWKQCGNLLNQLMSHQYGWVFNTPVDVVKLNIPDYLEIIKHPMDLGTIKGRITSGAYSSPMDFAADVTLTFSNALAYNAVGSDVYIMATTLSKIFEQRWKPIEKKMHANSVVESVPVTLDSHTGNDTINRSFPLKKKKDITTVTTSVVKQDPVKRTMSDEEKLKLSKELENLLSELPDRIIEFLRESSSSGGPNNEDEIEIDLDVLSDETLFKLRMLLDDYLLEKRKNQSTAESCEIQLHNESGFSNSSMQPCKVNDAADEVVDIGAQDPKSSRFPPVKIERDIAHKSNNSISSSSDSGSSSSDSDSSSSSGGESDGAKDLPPVKRLKTLNAEANLKQNQINPADHGVGRSQSQNDLSQPERTSLSKPLSVEVGGDKEGESAMSGRQVSPDKLYRAALLRNRFADTILKAQEKTLEKGEKRDPEKLRLEREELERRHREERARLQADAKAAEDARRKATLQAAAEAKRKRELEREAARLALQKMEKTVDINENSEFMEDLELLSSAPPDDLSTLLDNGSPNDGDNSLLGSFKLRGISNPLEQLGLYMKVDEEEEEEVEVAKRSTEPVNNEVEEGEIDH